MSQITKAIYDYIAAHPNVTSIEVANGLKEQSNAIDMKAGSVISLISLLTKAELLRSSKAHKGAARLSIDRVYDEAVLKAHRQSVYKKRIARNEYSKTKAIELSKLTMLESMPTIVDTEYGVAKHTFMLRPGLAIQFSLPLDLTIDEANRLANCIRILPFGTKFD